MSPPTVSALTLDLDDTLWPVWPTIERAEQCLHDWLLQEAPTMAQALGVHGLRMLRDQVALERPEWAHDFTAVRLESLRRGLQQYGFSPALADPAFEVFFTARHDVILYNDVKQALERLTARFPLLALSNGNADLSRMGLSTWFVGTVNAKQVGIAKPHSAIFRHACAVLRLPPARVLHVGDDLDLDVAGARAAGLEAVWLRREDTAQATRQAPVDVATLPDLTALVDWLGC